MSVFHQLVFLSCILLCFTEFNFGKSSAYLWTSQDLTCKHTIRVFFTSNTWKKQIGGNFNQDQFFVAVMGKIVTTAGGNGISCTFDKLNYKLTCCDANNLDKFHSVNKRERTAHSKFWSYDVFRINIVLLFVNLFFFLLILGWAIHVLACNTLETGTHLEHSGRTATY